MCENLLSGSLHRVFVYGTLKRGEPNNKLIADASKGYAKFIGVGCTVNKYPLVIATKYNIPFLLKESNVGYQVRGEVYDVNSKMLSALDELEEHPEFYNRTEENIRLTTNPDYFNKMELNFEEIGELTKAWIYFLPKFRPSLLDGPFYSNYKNEGEHGLKYMERYLRTPAYDHRKEVQ